MTGFIERLRLVTTNNTTLHCDCSGAFFWKVADCFPAALGQGDMSLDGRALSISVGGAGPNCNCTKCLFSVSLCL
jgi:hypothetical protein